MSKVFICYRRGGAAGEAHLLFSSLRNLLGKESVFKDVNSISPGHDFRKVIQRTLESCDIMLVVIGKHWAAVDESGKTRLEDPRDFVRLEIEAALKRDIPITPVLTQGALMPTAEQLPAEIRDFAYRNAFELSHNRWDSDVEEMIKRLGLRPSTNIQILRILGLESLAAPVTAATGALQIFRDKTRRSAFEAPGGGGNAATAGPHTIRKPTTKKSDHSETNETKQITQGTTTKRWILWLGVGTFILILLGSI